MAIMYLEEALAHIRAGKASTRLLDGIRVDSYGSMVPISNVAALTTPDARSITIKPWDKGMFRIIEKAIIDSDLGIMPENNGEVPYLTKYYKNTLVCYSYSKSLSLPGERIGYVLVPDEVDDARTIYAAVCGAGRALGFVCAPSLIQHVIAKCAGQVSDTFKVAVFPTSTFKEYTVLSTLYPAGADNSLI